MKLIFISVSIILTLSGCAFTADKADIKYQPQTSFNRIQGAEGVIVSVSVADSRQDKNKVSSKKNGFGMETAAITATNDVAVIIRESVEKELSLRGFQVGSNSIVDISANLSRFYNDFRPGVFSGEAEASISMLVTVNSNKGERLYIRQIDADGIEPSIQLMTGENAGIALSRALENGIQMLFSDAKFVAALLAAK